MKIKAVKLYDDGEFNEQFLFGGENKADGNPEVKYPGSLQNFLIDMENGEVILVDTSLPSETPFKGYRKVNDYIDAFKALGYKPEQVTTILVTHKHPDHTGELRQFPNAKVYIGPEDADFMKLTGENIIRCEYADGNSIVIAEGDDGVYYMMHGDVTYVDAALKKNKLSIVFEDLAAARDTLDRVREFVKNNPTIYLSTHTPEGYKNLEEKIIMKLD